MQYFKVKVRSGRILADIDLWWEACASQFQSKKRCGEAFRWQRAIEANMGTDHDGRKIHSQSKGFHCQGKTNKVVTSLSREDKLNGGPSSSFKFEEWWEGWLDPAVLEHEEDWSHQIWKYGKHGTCTFYVKGLASWDLETFLRQGLLRSQVLWSKLVHQQRGAVRIEAKPTVTRLEGSPIAKWEVIKAIVILSSRVKAIQNWCSPPVKKWLSCFSGNPRSWW